MGDCKYCGKPAGLLRSKHSECEKQYLHASKEKENGSRKIVDEAEQAITITSDYDAFETKILIIHNVSTNDTMGVFGNATFDTTTYTLGSGTNTQKYMLRKGDYDSDGHDNDIYLQEIIPEPKTISLSVIAGIPIFLWQQLSPTS